MSEEINKSEGNKPVVPEADISKVKIRQVLAQRIRKSKAKHIIAVILLVAICFGGGILTDRLIMRHEYKKGFYGRPGIQYNMRRNSFGKRNSKSFNKNNNQQPAQNAQPNK